MSIRATAALLALLGSLALAIPATGTASATAPSTAGASGTASSTASGTAANDRRLIATSVAGRAIVARHYGALDAAVQIVVFGQMHGNEAGGRKVTADLAAAAVPDGMALWLVTSMNPDGYALGRRGNAHGVDLNRNFPFDWARGRRGTYWPGRRPASEPETRGVIAFLRSVRPTAVLSYHQAFDVVDLSNPLSTAAARQLARYMGKQARPVGCSGTCHGTMTQWISNELGAIAVTVELDSHVSRAEAARAATAVLRLGQWLGR